MADADNPLAMALVEASVRVADRSYAGRNREPAHRDGSGHHQGGGLMGWRRVVPPNDGGQMGSNGFAGRTVCDGDGPAGR